MVGEQKASAKASLFNAGRPHLHPIFLALMRLKIHRFVVKYEVRKASSLAALYIANR
jgi:hypothetical protein